MSNNIIEYKGYHGKIEYSSEDNVLFGTILGINDLVTYEGETIQEVVDAFHDSVDDYLAYCKDIGKEPEREFKGSLNIRIPQDIHRKLYYKAILKGISLNEMITSALRFSLDYEDKLEEMIQKNEVISESVINTLENYKHLAWSKNTEGPYRKFFIGRVCHGEA